MTQNDLTHTDSGGSARMVDVGGKEPTRRTACARSVVRMRPETRDMILSGNMPKGDVFAAARIAGIQAAKRTPDLIPLCHVLPLEAVAIDISAGDDPGEIVIGSEVSCTAKTGAEMEALTAVSVTALTIYDMCKAADRDIVIAETALTYKSGGKSGEYVRGE